MFRFSIRDVLWLTVVMALALGWLSALRQKSAIDWKLTELRREYKELLVDWDYLRVVLSSRNQNSSSSQPLNEPADSEQLEIDRLVIERLRKSPEQNRETISREEAEASLEAEPGIYFLAPVR